jgi:hypothetical protein
MSNLNKYKDKFWSYVNIGNIDECWNWKGGVSSDGYGYFNLSRSESGSKSFRAHRLSYQFTHGSVPPKLCVCHTCDNKLCVNPNHLYIATGSRNRLDWLSKGNRTETNSYSKELLEEILKLHILEGRSLRSLSKQFNVDSTYISRLINFPSRRPDVSRPRLEKDEK